MNGFENKSYNTKLLLGNLVKLMHKGRRAEQGQCKSSTKN